MEGISDRGPDPDRARAPAKLEIRLTGLTHGPFAIGRREGQAVLVRNGAPGDDVIARVVRRHARSLVADLVEVRSSGPARRAAPCPFHPECGGCPWQQVSYPEQLAAKVANVRREIARLPANPVVVAAPAPAPAEWGYRRRIRLHVDRRGRVGFLRAASHEVVEIDACLVAEERLNATITEARALLGRLRTPMSTCDLLSRGELSLVVIAIGAAGRLARGDASTVKRFLAATPAVAGVVLSGPGWARRFGDPRVRFRTPSGAPIDLPPAAFTQVNEAANRLLVASVVAAAGPTPASRMLELHAGAGNFTLALAPRIGALLAVERNRSAAAALRRAVRHLPQVRVETAAARDVLPRLAASFDIALVDPPRTGLSEELAGLLALRTPRLVVVSCDLATFARDARALLGGGYRLARVDLVDLFPQTHHIELVGRFELAA